MMNRRLSYRLIVAVVVSLAVAAGPIACSDDDVSNNADAAASDAGQTPDSSDASAILDTAVEPDTADATDATDATDTADATDATDTTDTADTADTADAADATDTTDTTDTSDTSDATDATDATDGGGLADGECRTSEDCSTMNQYCRAPDEPLGCGICHQILGGCETDDDCRSDQICAQADPDACYCNPTVTICQARCADKADCDPGQSCGDDGHCAAISCESSSGGSSSGGANTDCPTHFECGSASGECERRTCTGDAGCPDGVCVGRSCYATYGACVLPIR